MHVRGVWPHVGIRARVFRKQGLSRPSLRKDGPTGCSVARERRSEAARSKSCVPAAPGVDHVPGGVLLGGRARGRQRPCRCRLRQRERERLNLSECRGEAACHTSRKLTLDPGALRSCPKLLGKCHRCGTGWLPVPRSGPNSANYGRIPDKTATIWPNSINVTAVAQDWAKLGQHRDAEIGAGCTTLSRHEHPVSDT